jgi:5-formyltetrahydrofolate cyclo-ligase
VNESSVAKQELRKKLSLPGVADAQKALSTLAQWSVFKDAETVGIYIAMKDEVKLDELLSCAKKVYLPIYDKVKESYEMALVQDSKDLVEGKFGILEPSSDCPLAAVDEIKLWLIPGRAFDRYGNRLGRGKGFYDRLLAGESGVKVGVPADGKVLDSLPVDEWDIKMNFLLLEDEVVKCK